MNNPEKEKMGITIREQINELSKKIDALRGEIKKLQKKCEHNFSGSYGQCIFCNYDPRDATKYD
jgi:hypothetical protein